MKHFPELRSQDELDREARIGKLLEWLQAIAGGASLAVLLYAMLMIAHGIGQ